MRRSNWLVLPAVASLMAQAAPAAAITRSEIVARAQEWVDAKLLYCVSTQGAYDATCKYTCNRQDNPAWNGYFSDCSGLITWAWGLSEAERLYTGSIAPYGGNKSFVIDAHDLQPGDALNDRSDPDGDGKLHHHVMLFGGWKLPGKVAIILQESGCGKVANRTEMNVQYAGEKLQVGQYKYFAVRFNGVAASESCTAHCEGTKRFTADCGSGDCAAYGATCLDDALGVRCAYEACPASGTYDVCLDDKQIAKCVNGIPQDIGDCSKFAAFCSTLGGAHCASAFCAEPNVPPVAHTSCFIDGSILHCDAEGKQTTSPCPTGTKCSVYPTPHCEANTGCPEAGDVRLCLSGRAVRCFAGTLAEVVDCPAQGRGCAVTDGLAVCTEDNSGDGPDGAAGTGAAGGAGTGALGTAGSTNGSAGTNGTSAGGKAGTSSGGGTTGTAGSAGQAGSAGKAGSPSNGGKGGTAISSAGASGKGGKSGENSGASAGGGGASGRRNGPAYAEVPAESGCTIPGDVGAAPSAEHRPPARVREGAIVLSLAALALAIGRRRRAPRHLA